MLYQVMDIFTRRKKLQGISIHSVFTWKEKSQGISVDSTNDGNNCTTKKVSWNQTERQTDLLCEFLRRNTDLNYLLMKLLLPRRVAILGQQLTISPGVIVSLLEKKDIVKMYKVKIYNVVLMQANILQRARRIKI